MATQVVQGRDAEGVVRKVIVPLPDAEPDPLPGVARTLDDAQLARAVAAFDERIAAFAEAAGPNDAGAAQAARKLLGLYSRRLAMRGHEIVLVVEYPAISVHPSTLDELSRRQYWPRHELGTKAMRGCSTIEEYFDLVWLDVDLRAIPLSDAIPLLLGAESPETEMARRRAAIAAKKKVAADAREAADGAKAKSDAELAEWNRINAARLQKWHGASFAARRLYALAARLPQYSELLVALAQVESDTSEKWIPMPECFFPELKGK